ncbi:response regulator [Qipengyuania sediminis]|uniref:response regulator n=1 Tax=Qipengyuania sediminis TaxID=1532023 RepID=UPI00105A6852|nr:response regulator [Qipengyuania sediminis]
MDGQRRSADCVLLVEDSMIIALDTEECLLDLGIGRVVVCDTVAGALSAVESERFAFAVLDYSLGGETSEEVGHRLNKCGVPFWLATGYGEMEDKIAELGARGVLVKPYGRAELTRVLAEFAGG